MELDFFQDKLFDLINECEYFDLTDLTVQNRNHTILVSLQNGTVLKVSIREAASPKKKTNTFGPSE